MIHPNELNLMKSAMMQDFPGAPMVENLPANAGYTGSIPCPGRFHMPRGNEAHVPQLLKPALLESVLHNKRSNHKATTATTEQPLLITTRETPGTATKTQHNQK